MKNRTSDFILMINTFSNSNAGIEINLNDMR